MRITFRDNDNKSYWKNRWTNIEADMPMTNLDKYPLKFSNLIINDKKQIILEAGCGAGRILRYYHECGKFRFMVKLEDFHKAKTYQTLRDSSLFPQNFPLRWRNGRTLYSQGILNYAQPGLYWLLLFRLVAIQNKGLNSTCKCNSSSWLSGADPIAS